jgi:hypothetical protein
MALSVRPCPPIGDTLNARFRFLEVNCAGYNIPGTWI